MLRNHCIEFGHHFFVRNEIAAISSINADLNEGVEIGFAFSNPTHCLSSKFRHTHIA